ncbi:MAG: ATP-binding cassette domain-containing protein [Actinomycetota bacterium]|nr:ATP-binding cassette domain-containing protein [Actinomycetota bacterium]
MPVTLATLVARDISVSFGATTILDEVSLTAAPGDRIGLVAPNGTGKTTLLRVMAGLLVPDSGTVTTAPATASIGYLAQEPERSTVETVRHAVARRTGVAAATAAHHAAATELADGTARAAEAYAAAQERWMALGGADLDARLSTLWDQLGLDSRLLVQATDSLSGGEAARAALAVVLLSRHHILLLDEPTNDLDFAALDRLEQFVVTREAPLVLVSHDRAFLQRTITAVAELDEHTNTLTRFEGGWDAYLEERAVARRHAVVAYQGYRSARHQLEERARTQRMWSDQGLRKAKKNPRDGDKMQQGFFADRTEKQASKVRQSDRALSRLNAHAPHKPFESWDLRFEIAQTTRSGAMVARLEDAVVSRGGFTLGPVNLEVRWADRIAIVGVNGAGKSTLLDALLGRIALHRGTQRLGPGVVVGEIDQGRALFGGNRPLLATFLDVTGMDSQVEARTLLAKFGLTADHVVRRAASLTPGERTRASLAVLQGRGVNCLVLDEPTNHLDLAALEQVEQAVEGFGGSVLLVTHDRALLDAITTTRTLHLVAGRVTEERG